MHTKALFSIAAILSFFETALASPKRTPLPANVTSFPRHFGVVVYNGFAPLDNWGPFDVLTTLSNVYPELGMHFSTLSATLDPVSTRLLNGEPGRTNPNNGTLPWPDFGQAVNPTDTFDAVLSRGGKAWVEPYPPAEGQEDGQNVTKILSPVEVLIVPGGGSSGPRESEIGFIKAMYPRLNSILGICGGSTMLARAGVLDGKSSTSNKMAWNRTMERVKDIPNIEWVRHARWVHSGNVWSSSGLSAGLDAGYAYVGHYLGEELADYIAIVAEYNRTRDWRKDPFADLWVDE